MATNEMANPILYVEKGNTTLKIHSIIYKYTPLNSSLLCSAHSADTVDVVLLLIWQGDVNHCKNGVQFEM